jgi:hypothetical protein
MIWFLLASALTPGNLFLWEYYYQNLNVAKTKRTILYVLKGRFQRYLIPVHCYDDRLSRSYLLQSPRYQARSYPAVVWATVKQRHTVGGKTCCLPWPGAHRYQSSLELRCRWGKCKRQTPCTSPFNEKCPSPRIERLLVGQRFTQHGPTRLHRERDTEVSFLRQVRFVDTQTFTTHAKHINIPIFLET